MGKTKNLSYILGLACIVAFAACQSAENAEREGKAKPGDTIVINNTTKVYLDLLENDVNSGMGAGFGWLNGEGVFVTTTPDLTSDDPAATVKTTTKVGGESRSDGRVQLPVIDCGEEFIDPVFTLTAGPDTTDVSTTDSIGARTIAVYNGTDGQTLTLEDLWRYVSVGVTEAIPHVEPTSSIAGVRYEAGTDENSRIVWVKVEVQQTGVEGTRRSSAMTQQYEIGYVQTKAGAVEPEQDPYEVRIKDFQLFRTYRKKTQHSICEGYLSFGVYNTRTGELVEEIVTDDFSMQLGKTGHFGSPSNGYIVGEARLIGSAPTSVTETELTDNEEAITASHKSGNFTVTVTCTAQDYYVHFPVRGRDDSEGGMPAGGQNLFFHATLTYTRPATATEPAWNKTWTFSHKTDVNVVGWETRTPAVDRSGETVNDVDGERKLQYAKSFIVEFVNHLYLDGEEIVQVEGDDDFYYPVSKTTGTTKPFHTSEMSIDCWTSYLP